MPTARYWRINITANEVGSGQCRIAEIEFRDSGGVDLTDPVTADTAASASSVSDSEVFSAAKAFDNTTYNSDWESNTLPGWIKYDFGSDVTVEYTAITAGADGNQNKAPKDFTIEYSSDDTNWTVHQTVTGEINWASEEARVFPDDSNQTASSEDVINIADSGAGALALGSVSSDIISITDEFTAGVVVFYAETITITESVTGQIRPNTVDLINIAEAAAGVLAITQARSDTITIAESAQVHLTGNTSDTVTIGETSPTRILDASVDTVTVAESPSGVLAITQARSDVLRVIESTVGLVSVTAVDTITVVENTGGQVHGYQVATDTVTISETLGAKASIFDIAIDTITVTDTALGALTLAANAADIIRVYEEVGDRTPQVLVVNADTGAVSTYTFIPTVYGLGEFNGTLYLVTSTGLYALDNTDDAGSAITWEFRTGFTNLGDERLKSFEDVNALLRADGDVMAIVTHARNGLKKERHYKLTKLNRTAVRDGVIPVGRGLSGTHWSFGMRGKNAAEIDEIRPNIIVDSRRR